MTVSVTHEGPVSKVVFANPPQNLLTIDIMEELLEAHRQADANPETRVILTLSGTPGIFSNGLDIPYVLKKSEPERAQVFRAVARMLHGLFGLGKPHIAVVTGPAMAGGAILAVTADFRVFEASAGRISFAEPKVGLPILEPITAVIRQCCHSSHLRDVVMLGKNMDAQAALASGLADEAAPAAELEETVEKLAGRLARLSPAVLKATKAALRKDALHKTLAFCDGDPRFESFVGDRFLGEGLRAILEQRFPTFVA